LKVFQVTEGASSHPKRTPNPSKNESFSLFSYFVGHFCLPGSGSSPDPKRWPTDPTFILFSDVIVDQFPVAMHYCHQDLADM
jgi:hypothetical protein